MVFSPSYPRILWVRQWSLVKFKQGISMLKMVSSPSFLATPSATHRGAKVGNPWKCSQKCSTPDFLEHAREHSPEHPDFPEHPREHFREHFHGFPTLAPLLKVFFCKDFCGFGSERKSLVNLSWGFRGKTEKWRNGRTGSWETAPQRVGVCVSALLRAQMRQLARSFGPNAGVVGCGAVRQPVHEQDREERRTLGQAYPNQSPRDDNQNKMCAFEWGGPWG